MQTTGRQDTSFGVLCTAGLCRPANLFIPSRSGADGPRKCRNHLRFQPVAGASPEPPCDTFFGYAALVEQRLFALATALFPLLLIHEGVGACKQFDEVAQGSVGGVGGQDPDAETQLVTAFGHGVDDLQLPL